MTTDAARSDPASFVEVAKNASAADAKPEVASPNVSTELERERFLVATASEEVAAALCVTCPTLIRPIALMIAIFSGRLDRVGAHHEARGEWKQAYRDYERSVALAEVDNLDARYKMAYCLLYGLDAIHIDRERAMGLLLQCSSSGHIAARSLFNGLGGGGGLNQGLVTPNVAFAVGAISVSGPITPDVYQLHWADRFMRGSMAVRGDTQNALALIDGAIREMMADAERGCVRAQYELSVVHYGQKNYIESLRWRLRAAAQGHAAALRMMGEMYEYGLGKPRDLTAARDYYARAAAQGDLNSVICQSRAR